MQGAQSLAPVSRVYFGGESNVDESKKNQDKTDGTDNENASKAPVLKLLKELEDAQKTNKSQTVQASRDNLNEMREKLGEEKFKEIIEHAKKDASDDWLAFLRRIFPDLFPDDGSIPLAPKADGGAGRGQGASKGQGVDRGQGASKGQGASRGQGGPGPGPGSANRNAFPRGESMSNLPLTEGANHSNYRPDNSSPGKKPDNVWSGFSQSPGTLNCVTISAIKAAMQKYGEKPTDVYQSVQETGGGYHVKMRDGFELDLSKAELREASAAARFKGDNPSMLTNANFMYAVSAKRAQMEGNDGAGPNQMNYTQALATLMDTEYAGEGLARLGLKYREGNMSDLAAGMIGTLLRDGHDMAVIDNREELNGTRAGTPRYGVDGRAIIHVLL